MPKYNLAHKWGKINCYKQLKEWATQGLIVQLDKVINTRSNQQNRALHLFFEQLAQLFTDMGIEFEYKSLVKQKPIWMPYNKELIKETIWKPMQKKMFNIDSTTKLTTQMINDILDVLTLWFAEQGIEITFPNKIDLLIKQMEENNK
jgi:hypothetical protein